MPEEWISFKDGNAQIRRGSKIWMEARAANVFQQLGETISPAEAWDSSDVSFLPQGTRFFARVGAHELIVVEQPPQKRTIRWVRFRSEEERLYHLAFPYVIFAMCFESGFLLSALIYYRKSPLSRADQELYYPNLPNIDSDGSLCLGDLESDFRVDVKDPLIQRVETVISGFWQSTFNRDLPDLWIEARYYDPRIRNLRSWQEATRQDSRFVLTVPWKKYGTLEEAIEELKRRERINRPSGSSSSRTIENRMRTIISQIGWKRR